MSASMMRYACRSSQRLFRLHRHKETSYQSRTKSDVTNLEDLDDVKVQHYNDNMVPYLPEQENISSLQAKYPEVIISREEFKYVKRILPHTSVPPIPEAIECPTPSGWIPPIASKQPSEYGMSRSKNSMLPVYLKQHRSGRISTAVKNVHGDIHKLNEDIQNYLKESGVSQPKVQIHEVGNFLRYKGNHVIQIANFCLEKGF